MLNVSIVLYEFSELSKTSKDVAIAEYRAFLHEIAEDGEEILTNKTIVDNINDNDNDYFFWANGELAPVCTYYKEDAVINKTVLYLQGDTYLIREDKTDLTD